MSAGLVEKAARAINHGTSYDGGKGRKKTPYNYTLIPLLLLVQGPLSSFVASYTATSPLYPCCTSNWLLLPFC